MYFHFLILIFLPCSVLLKLTTDRHETTRGLFATAELLVAVESTVTWRQWHAGFQVTSSFQGFFSVSYLSVLSNSADVEQTLLNARRVGTRSPLLSSSSSSSPSSSSFICSLKQFIIIYSHIQTGVQQLFLYIYSMLYCNKCYAMGDNRTWQKKAH